MSKLDERIYRKKSKLSDSIYLEVYQTISNELMEKYYVQKVIKNEESIIAGHVSGYLGECDNGKWLVVVTDHTWEEVEVLKENTRATAMNRLRERGFFSRVHKIYPPKVLSI
ncbi:hypothetical protein [Paenisporosarcina indica]|uniref:hypothetical protein n=1 Tax=Paenisporosarcina indica TaxID=650093 RepID=UPI001FE24EB4|nr:hypothetical protein [Paenisporosarcina indica]